VRAVIQASFTFKMPAGGFWDFPGIPSLMVPYGLASDFYYSGHTGYFVLILREWVVTERSWLRETLILLCMCYMVVTVLLFKIHYSIGSRRLNRHPGGHDGCLGEPPAGREARVAD
jgi:hypothetical protein